MNLKTLSIVSLFTLSSCAANALAHEYDHNSCNTNLEGELNFANNQFTVQSSEDESILFKANGEVFVDGTKLKLSAQDTAIALQYYNGVESSIPMVVDITTEALSIANYAVTEVFTAFLGEDSSLPQLIDEKLDNAARTIKEHVYQDPNSLTFNSETLEQEFGFNDDFDQQIEEIKDEILSSFMGEIFIAIGKAMLNKDDGFSDFEQRMESLGDDIELRVEQHSNNLKEKSIALCEKMEALEGTESELQKIEALRYLNMIEINNKA